MTVMTQEVADIAATIRHQIGTQPLMSVGATELRPTLDKSKHYRPGLTFVARILPFTKTGDRALRPRRMRVTVTLNPSDTYTVAVTYKQGEEFRTHFLRSGVYAEELAHLVLALDYDGDTAVNPRLA